MAEHIYRFTAALDVWQHPFWRQSAVDDLDAYVSFVREETDLKLGIEADYLKGREDRMANLLDAHEWDYVVGSVHFLGDFAVDFDDETDIWRYEMTPERVWTRYFEVRLAAQSIGSPGSLPREQTPTSYDSVPSTTLVFLSRPVTSTRYSLPSSVAPATTSRNLPVLLFTFIGFIGWVMSSTLSG